MSKLNSLINSLEFTDVTKKMRRFFEQKGWVEVHTQNRLSILAACEDPATISCYNYGGAVWPLPQTGQMWLEYELLKNPEWAGVFCVSTSFRNEPNPVEGRHDKIFPMFEFEMRGDMNDLIHLEAELLEFLGFGEIDQFIHKKYLTLTEKYEVRELEHEHEEQMCHEFGPIVFLEEFPNYTSPFWNMKQSEDKLTAKKVDVIMHGIETIGSAERSTDTEEMRNQFYTISEGNYANILFSNFTKERVEEELEEFLNLDFFPRCGGGIGITRMIRAMKLSNLLHKPLQCDIEQKIEEELLAKKQLEEAALEEDLLKKTKKSRCWGLPASPKRKNKIVNTVTRVASKAGVKAFEMAGDALI